MSELWNWRVDEQVPAVEIYLALADILGVTVLPLGGTEPSRVPPGAALCEVWRVPGEFPISVDCYGVPVGHDEVSAAAIFSRRLGRACLLTDDTLDPGRRLLVAPEGTIRAVHFDVCDSDDGEILFNRRSCSALRPHCHDWSRCASSRFAPDRVVPALAPA